MKPSVTTLLATLWVAAAPHAGAAISYDPGTGILTDTTAQRMWVLHGIGFGSSYLFPGFANTWVEGLNLAAHGGYADWHLPTVMAPADGSPPVAMTGDLGQLFMDLAAAYDDRSLWPFTLGSDAYGGNIIYTDASVPNTANFWGLSFGNGGYVQIYPGNAYAYVGVLAVRPVPEPATWALLLAGLGLISTRLRLTKSDDS